MVTPMAKSFKYLTQVFCVYMPLAVVRCPYCATENQLQSVERTVTDKFTLKIIAHERSDKMTIPMLIIRCRLCNKTYELVKVQDYLWIKNQLKPTDTMLEKFKIRFPKSSLDMIYEHVTGIARPQSSTLANIFLRYKHLHICFELEGTRAYVDCQEVKVQGKSILQGLDICEV